MKSFFFGFLFAIFLIAVSTVLWFVFVMGNVSEGCKKCRMADFNMKDIGTGLYYYFNDNKDLPDRLDELPPDYLRALPSDPWGNPYQYTVFEHQNKTCFMLWTLGSDFEHGGTGIESDLATVHDKGNCF